MKKGLIIYPKMEKERNLFFINKCLEEFNKSQISLLYKDEEDVLEYLKNNHVGFVIYRARDYRISEALEKQGIKVFNNSVANKIANDKYLTYLFLKENNLPYNESFLNKDELDYPFIYKSRNGHGGKEVFLISNKDDLKEKDNYIYQRYMPNDGDVRIYLINDSVVIAVKRTNKNDYRSNFSLGGEVSLYQPSKEMVDSAIKVARLLKSDYIGVDFLLTKDGFIINEIEDPVGARMVYQTSCVDIIDLFIKAILAKL